MIIQVDNAHNLYDATFQFLLNVGPLTREEFEKCMIILEEVDGQILGCLAWEHYADSANLTFLAVLEEYRGNGVGTNLLNYFINQKHVSDDITLNVSANNLGAIKLYERLGFVKHEFIENHYPDSGEGLYTGDGTNAYQMLLPKLQ